MRDNDNAFMDCFFLSLFRLVVDTFVEILGFDIDDDASYYSTNRNNIIYYDILLRKYLFLLKCKIAIR